MTKISIIELFRTPDNWAELYDWIYTHNSEDRAHLTTAAVMAWNLAAQWTNTDPAEIDAATFSAKEDFAHGLPRASCNLRGLPRQAWLNEWDACAEARKSRPPTHTEPADRQAARPFPERPNSSGPSD